MAKERAGVATWAGTLKIEACSYTLSHGATPGQATLSVIPTIDVPDVTGTLVITDGIGTVVLPGCRVGGVTYSVGQNGRTLHLFILDRRWRWAYPKISGHYNVRDDKGQIKKGTERTPSQLATLCFEAMRERGYRIAGLDPTARPEVEWDCENAAQALQSLVEPLACRLIYDAGTDRAGVVPLGEGGPLPGGSLSDDEPSLKVAELVDAIEFVGAPIRYQCRLLLEAVGVDLDGQIKPIDRLAYKPTLAGGWKYSWPPNYPNIPASADLPGAHTQGEAERLAQQSVWKMYRVKLAGVPDGKGPLVIPGYKGKVTSRDQITLLPNKVDTTEDLDGHRVADPAQVYGSYYPGGGTLATTDARRAVKVGFQVDSGRGLVIFDEPVYAMKDDAVAEPTLILETAVTVRDAATLGLVRFRKLVRVGARVGRRVRNNDYSTAPLEVRRDDVQFDVVTDYTTASKPIKTTDNHKGGRRAGRLVSRRRAGGARGVGRPRPGVQRHRPRLLRRGDPAGDVGDRAGRGLDQGEPEFRARRVHPQIPRTPPAGGRPAGSPRGRRPARAAGPGAPGPARACRRREHLARRPVRRIPAGPCGGRGKLARSIPTEITRPAVGCGG
jgi:hypothetical protein